MTTISLTGTDQTIAGEVGLFSGYSTAAADLTNRIKSAVTAAGFVITAASFQPDEFTPTNWLDSLSTSTGIGSAGPLSWSGSVTVTATEDGNGTVTAAIQAAVSAVVTSVTSAMAGTGILDTVANDASSLVKSVSDALAGIGNTANTLSQGANTVAGFLPWLLIGGALLILFVIFSDRKSNLFKLI